MKHLITKATVIGCEIHNPAQPFPPQQAFIIYANSPRSSGSLPDTHNLPVSLMGHQNNLPDSKENTYISSFFPFNGENCCNVRHIFAAEFWSSSFNHIYLRVNKVKLAVYQMSFNVLGWHLCTVLTQILPTFDI